MCDKNAKSIVHTYVEKKTSHLLPLKVQVTGKQLQKTNEALSVINILSRTRVALKKNTNSSNL